MITLKEQHPDQIIDIANFPKEYEVYPEGARVKTTFILPADITSYDFCTPSWLYMFKTSNRRYLDQFWVEIFAYQLGCLVNVPVPPAFVAHDSKEKIAGVVIEWFYNQYEDEYIRGGDVMQSMIGDYDIKRGLQHNLVDIFDFIKALNWGPLHWTIEWAKILIFDALIGNSDRHQGNWGIIGKYGRLDTASRNEKTNSKIVESMMSPAFDNGTSMGHEIYERDFHKFNMEKYVKKGKPHVMWDLNQEWKKKDNHENLIIKMAEAYPHCRDQMINCLQFSDAQIKEILQRLSAFRIEPRLSEARAKFMLNLLLYRQNKLLLALRA